MALNQVRLGIIVAIYEICSRPSCAVVRIAETCVLSLMILKSHIFTFINLKFLFTMLFLTKTFESFWTSLWNCSTKLKMSPPPQKKKIIFFHLSFFLSCVFHLSHYLFIFVICWCYCYMSYVLVLLKMWLAMLGWVKFHFWTYSRPISLHYLDYTFIRF